MTGSHAQTAPERDPWIDASHVVHEIEIDRLGDWAGAYAKAAEALDAYVAGIAGSWLGLLVERGPEVPSPVRLKVGARRVGEEFEQPAWRVLDKRAHVREAAIFSAVYRLGPGDAAEAIRACGMGPRNNVLFLTSRSEEECVTILNRIVALRHAERSKSNMRLSGDSDDLRLRLAQEGVRLVRVWDGLRENPSGGFHDRILSLEIF